MLLRLVLPYCLMPTNYWVDVFLTSTYLINRIPTKFFSFISPWQKWFSALWITHHYGCLVMHVINGYSLTQTTNLNPVINSVFSLVTVSITKDISAWAFIQGVFFFFFTMLYLMNPNFPANSQFLNLNPHLGPLFYSYRMMSILNSMY